MSKQVVSVSLGSSRRDHCVHTRLAGHQFAIRRVGVDGDRERAVETIRRYDGTVDCLGLGGADAFLYVGNKQYILEDGYRLLQLPKKTPMVDGSGLKNTLERDVAFWLRDDPRIRLAGKKVLLTCAVDRFGLAESLLEVGCRVTFGDLVFIFGVDMPLASLEEVELWARKMSPRFKLPIEMLYPTGTSQEKPPEPKFEELYREADVIAGDFHLIRKYLPARLDRKIVLTNTTTAEDAEALRSRGVEYLVTTTPVLQGRSFGTNLMEAALVALIDKPLPEITADDYREKLRELEIFRPAVMKL